jgi:hypothetical protein
MKQSRVVPILLLVLLLGGCGGNFIYNQLDWLIPWWMDDYVDLSRDQKKDLKARLQPLLQWHREEELRNYLILLDDIDAGLRRELSPQDLQRWAEEMWLAYIRLEKKSLPMLYAMGTSMSDGQMGEFMESLYKEQAKLEKKYLKRSDEEFLEDSLDNLEENMTDFLGRLQPTQKQRLQLAAEQLQRFDAAWLEERRRWLDTLAGILLDRQPDWEQRIEVALDQREDNRTEAYSQGYEANQRLIFQAMADVLNNRSERQDAKLRREIGSLRKTLLSLIPDTVQLTPAQEPGLLQ